MRLHVLHETRYDYAPPVETAQHMAHLKPLARASQQLLSHALHVQPEPAQRSESTDVYGNTRAFFALESTHEQLVVTAESLVETAPPQLSPIGLSLLGQLRYYTTGTGHVAAATVLFSVVPLVAVMVARKQIVRLLMAGVSGNWQAKPTKR